MIDKIVDARRRGRGTQYLVRWVGYDRDHDEWLSGKMLEDTEALDIWEAENGTEVLNTHQIFLGGEGCKDAEAILPQTEAQHRRTTTV
jgi:hypothetical protein